MTIDGDKNIPRISNANMTSGVGGAMMARANDATLTTTKKWLDTTVTVGAWEGISAYFGYLESDGYTYIRIADGGDKNPNNRNIRWSAGGGNSGFCSNCYPPGQTIKMDNVSYNTIRDLSIRGGRYAVFIYPFECNMITL